MSRFDQLAAIVAGELHHDTVQLFGPVRLSDGAGGFYDGEPQALGCITGNLQSYSAELAQKEYGVACKTTRRLFCSPDDRIQPGNLVEGWRIVAVPVRCSYVVALLEEVNPRGAYGS